jgi:Rv2175c C-terminal domain of unknown function
MDWLNLPDVAEQLGVPITRVRAMVKERKILAARQDGVLRVPSDFVQGGVILKGLTGLLTLLSDAGYSDAEALDWLYREDASLPGTPIQALAENRGTEVKRRAQALGF